MVASGRLQAKPFAEERFNKTGVGAEPNEFDLWVNTGMYRDPMQLANHEMNHYTDYINSKNPLTRKRAIFAQNAKKWKHNGRKKK